MRPAPEPSLAAFFASPDALRLARAAPLELLARALGLALPLADRPALEATLGRRPPWLDRMLALPGEARAEALRRGLDGGDGEAARLAAAILVVGGPLLSAALSPPGRAALVEGLVEGLRAGPDPLPRLASGAAAALRSADEPAWASLGSLLRAAPGVQATIEADDRSSVERGSIDLPPAGGPISAAIRASRRSNVADSSITVGARPAPGARPPARHPALEITLYRSERAYSAEARLTRPESGAEVAHPAQTALDPAALRAEALDPLAYGRRLTGDLLADAGLRSVVVSALRLAQAAGPPLRLRVRLAAGASELHGLRWETLCDPVTGAPLATSQQVWLTRALDSADWTAVAPRPAADLRALAVIASPGDLAAYQLAPLDVEAEAALARSALGARTTVLAGAEATLERVGAALRQGYDLLYLIGHGRSIDGETHLWLSGEDGRAAVTPGHAIVQRVRELQRRPLLAALMTCESAGDGDAGALVALGPQLVGAGIPAVVAAQARLSMETAARFTPALFAALRKQGQVDRAVAEARAAVRARDDWWAPALLTSLAEGRLW